MALQNGFRPSGKGRNLTITSSEEAKWLSLLVNSIETLTSMLHNLNPFAFVVGTTTGSPTNGQSTWTVKTLLLPNNPTLLVNGVNTAFTVSGQVITLNSGTFSTNDIVTLII